MALAGLIRLSRIRMSVVSSRFERSLEPASAVQKHKPANVEIPSGNEMKVLLLTSSLFTDRMFVYSRLLERLGKTADVRIWATSINNPRNAEMWSSVPSAIEKFPKIDPYPEFPHNYLRRINEQVWDHRQKPPSRLSLAKYRDDGVPPAVRVARPLSNLLAGLGLERVSERAVEKLMISHERSVEARERLENDRPDVLFTTGPFQYKQPAISVAAKRLGIPVLALIPSWDNLSTKKRMVLNYDGYMVWSESNKAELEHFYPEVKGRPIYVIGAPQFDVFFDESFYISRDEFCSQQGLDPVKKIIVYAVGSPNFLIEHHGALFMADRVVRGDLGDVQLLVRPHPLHDEEELAKSFTDFGERVKVQRTTVAGEKVLGRTQDRNQITEWINTFRHADVVVNLSSTVAIDAALFDKPVVNLDFDPQPGQADQELIKDINHKWTHFKPVAESGGVWLVNDYDELVAAVKTYLEKPELHREERRWMAEYVCGYVDGMCGERMADAILDFAAMRRAKS